MEGKILVIVESPGKIKKIKSYLGSDYIVMASIGHVMDLPQKRLGINKDTYMPEYEIYPDKKKIVSNFKSIISKNKNIKVFIASDGDREGEFIGYSLVELLKLKNYNRIIFHEITKNAIIKAIEEKQPNLNNNLICAQMCRRIIDRLIGYPISKELSRNINGAYSAGRVQSVIVKLIYDKCNERDEFISNNMDSTYFTCNANFIINGSKLLTNLIIPDIKKNNVVKTDYNCMLKILQLFQSLPRPINIKITNIIERQSLVYPPKPFITSSLQQDGYYKYKYPPEKTMLIAQHLYEKGLITYMRTDSPTLSNDVLSQIKQYITTNYDPSYYQFKQYKSNNISKQEAHEAIRPTHINMFELTDDYNIDEKNLYDLIWKRTVASQMIPCTLQYKDIYIQYTDNIKLYNLSSHFLQFMGTITTIVEKGFKIIYGEETDEDTNNNIMLDINNLNNIKVILKDMSAKEQMKTISPLYNMPTIIKTLEKYGIGRPSTFATLLKKILDHKYVSIGTVPGIKKEIREIHLNNSTISFKSKETTIGSEKQKYIITDLGKSSTEYLAKHYPMLLDYKFTADMETKLDLIAQGNLHYINVIKEFVNNIKLNGLIN